MSAARRIAGDASPASSASALRNRSLRHRPRHHALVIAAMALVSFVWTPYDVTRLIDRRPSMQPPSPAHWFGTDHFGRDILSMIMVGARNSIAVALVAVGIGMGIGVPLGCSAAARGGWSTRR